MTLYRYTNLSGVAFQDDNGDPLAGGLLHTYLAATTTPAATYTDDTGNVANANPIVLDAAGRIPLDIWLTGGIQYKAELQDADGVTIQTWDNIGGINDATGLDAQEWVAGPALTWTTATTATAEGDQTEIYQVGRRVWITSGAGETYGDVTASSYDSGTNKTTVSWQADSGNPAVTNPISAQSYGFLSPDNPSFPLIGDRYINTTAVGNVGSGEDDLMAQTIPAWMLDPVGARVRITAFFRGNATDNVTVKFRVGASNHWTVMSGASIGADIGTLLVHVDIVRVSSTTIAVVPFGFLAAAVTSTRTAGTQALATGADLDIKFTGENTSDTSDDAVVQAYMSVEKTGY